jgi:hypothetical protein
VRCLQAARRRPRRLLLSVTFRQARLAVLKLQLDRDRAQREAVAAAASKGCIWSNGNAINSRRAQTGAWARQRQD